MTLTIVAWVFGWAVLHLGHSVTVAGSRTHESMAREKADEKKEAQVEKASGKEEYADLSVTNLKMVSETCNK